MSIGLFPFIVILSNYTNRLKFQNFQPMISGKHQAGRNRSLYGNYIFSTVVTNIEIQVMCSINVITCKYYPNRDQQKGYFGLYIRSNYVI